MANVSNWWNNLTEEERQAERDKRSEAGRKYWASISEKEREERGRLTSEGLDNPETKQKLSSNTTRRNLEWADQGIHPFQDLELKESVAQLHKDFWEDKSKEEEQRAIIKKIAQNQTKTNNGKTHDEGLLEYTLELLFPGEWRYNEQCWFMLGRKFPDFVNVNGQKKVIEVFGDYWHEFKEVQEKKDYYAQFGYKTLVLWDHEIYNKYIDYRLVEFCSKSRAKKLLYRLKKLIKLAKETVR